MTATTAHIRWIKRSDLDEILPIERKSFDTPWTVSQFIAFQKQRNVIGVVMEDEIGIVGYMFYSLYPGVIQIDRFAVDPECRRRGLATAAIQRITDRLRDQQRHTAEVIVSERNDAAHGLLKACGFRAVRVVRKRGEDDSYVFRYAVQGYEE